MGLAERRSIQNFKDKHFPAIQEDIDKVAGFAVQMEIQWDTLCAEGRAEYTAEWLPKVYFTPLRDAFAAVACDALGKEALAAGLKKVEICNKSEQYGRDAFKFESGVLSIDHRSDVNIDDVEERTKHLQQLLESKL